MPRPTANSAAAEAFRLLPAVDEVLRLTEGAGLDVRREDLRAFVQAALDDWRSEIRDGRLDAAGLERRLETGTLLAELNARVARDRGAGVVRAINATGVVLHTGLGRAPVHPEAAEAMAEAARSYCVLEVDRFSGQRNQRDARVGELLARLTGAETGIVVNNNAAAVVLVLSTFAAGKETVLSRGELVEIGGSFRMPDVMERAGTRLREVGTTNRTRISDYENAIGKDTGLLLKVHTSNYRVEGFTEEVDSHALAELGRRHGIPTSFDLGSGLFDSGEPGSMDWLGEPRVADEVASGIDTLMFSGDKLFGGPQAGLIVGNRDAIARARKNPLYRAMRLDKVMLAGLERTLELWLEGRAEEIPARGRMRFTRADLAPAASELAVAWRGLEGLDVDVVDERSQPGSGSAPGVFIDTLCVRVRPRSTAASAERLAAALRAGDPPVFCRIHEGALLFDLRALEAEDRQALALALPNALRRSGAHAGS